MFYDSSIPDEVAGLIFDNGPGLMMLLLKSPIYRVCHRSSKTVINDNVAVFSTARVELFRMIAEIQQMAAQHCLNWDRLEQYDIVCSQ